jgi:hypothetical protein
MQYTDKKKKRMQWQSVACIRERECSASTFHRESAYRMPSLSLAISPLFLKLGSRAQSEAGPGAKETGIQLQKPSASEETKKRRVTWADTSRVSPS